MSVTPTPATAFGTNAFIVTIVLGGARGTATFTVEFGQGRVVGPFTTAATVAIPDTGLTLAYLVGQLQARSPRRLSTCAMLDRPVRRIVPQVLDYRGFELGTEYVLGYGLHVRDLYRNVPYVVSADRDTLVNRPDAYVADLYRRRDATPDSGHGSGPDSARNAGGRVTAVPTEEP
jgi:hypothetical protein